MMNAGSDGLRFHAVAAIAIPGTISAVIEIEVRAGDQADLIPG
jgi:hypothetical protein